MAHVGKPYPRHPDGFDQWVGSTSPVNSFGWAPRKWRCTFGPGAGSLAVKWSNSERYTEVGYRNADADLEWRLNFDGDPDIYFAIVGHLIRGDGIFGTQDVLYRELAVSYWEGGLMYGRRKDYRALTYVVALPAFTFNISNFQELLNPALFVGFTSPGMSVYVANWAEQPDYHPYRH